MPDTETTLFAAVAHLLYLSGHIDAYEIVRVGVCSKELVVTVLAPENNTVFAMLYRNTRCHEANLFKGETISSPSYLARTHKFEQPSYARYVTKMRYMRGKCTRCFAKTSRAACKRFDSRVPWRLCGACTAQCFVTRAQAVTMLCEGAVGPPSVHGSPFLPKQRRIMHHIGQLTVAMKFHWRHIFWKEEVIMQSAIMHKETMAASRRAHSRCRGGSGGGSRMV
jgi:hypothetical protein